MADEGLFMFGDDLETILDLLEGLEAMEREFVSAVSEVSESYSFDSKISPTNQIEVCDLRCKFKQTSTL